jgi:hypothetical protein
MMVRFEGVIVVFSHSFSCNPSLDQGEYRLSNTALAPDPSDSNLNIGVFQLIQRSSKCHAQAIAYSQTREKKSQLKKHVESWEPEPIAYISTRTGEI